MLTPPALVTWVATARASGTSAPEGESSQRRAKSSALPGRSAAATAWSKSAPDSPSDSGASLRSEGPKSGADGATSTMARAPYVSIYFWARPHCGCIRYDEAASAAISQLSQHVAASSSGPPSSAAPSAHTCALSHNHRRNI